MSDDSDADDDDVDSAADHQSEQAMPDENQLQPQANQNRQDINDGDEHTGIEVNRDGNLTLIDFEMAANSGADDAADVLEEINRRVLHTRLLVDFETGVWFFIYRRQMRDAGLIPAIPAEYEKLAMTMIDVFLTGFAHHQEHIGVFLKDCLPNLAPLSKAYRPTRKSDQKSLDGGVPHCLVYGRSSELGPRQARRRYRQIEENRKCGLSPYRSRSRSRSPTPEVFHERFYRKGFDHQPRLAERRRYPEEILVKNEAIGEFIESHIPDVMFIDYSRSNWCYPWVKLVVEITGNVKYGQDVDFYPSYVEYVTAKCVWSCFSSLQPGQTKIVGLCCFVEGFRGIKVEKTADNQWGVYETKFVHFTNSDDVGLLLSTINDEVGVTDHQ